MIDIKFRAVINETTTVSFTLEDLVNPQPLFSIRELVIPWLRQGNKPAYRTGLYDKNGKGIWEGDSVWAYSINSNESDEGVVYWEDEHAGFYIEFTAEHAEPMSFPDILEVIEKE